MCDTWTTSRSGFRDVHRRERIESAVRDFLASDWICNPTGTVRESHRHGMDFLGAGFSLSHLSPIAEAAFASDGNGKRCRRLIRTMRD